MRLAHEPRKALRPTLGLGNICQQYEHKTLLSYKKFYCEEDSLDTKKASTKTLKLLEYSERDLNPHAIASIGF